MTRLILVRHAESEMQGCYVGRLDPPLSVQGRAQIMQSQAAGVEPRVEMNPILLKPHEDKMAQVIVLGEVVRQMSAQGYHRYKPQLLAGAH